MGILKDHFLCLKKVHNHFHGANASYPAI